ncbi:MAG: hypothetical protein QOI76_1477 [Frankiales bacterium]|jgi:hypothetical protein|nr:hypothetical protein [Frankiales bacterium]
MSCEHLVCANCAGPVDEGRCPTCRAAHASLHARGGGLSPQTVLIMASLAVLLVMLFSRVHG